MTLEQYRTVIDTYLDFYPDERIDVQITDDFLRKALDTMAEGGKVSQRDKDYIEGSTLDSVMIIVHYPELELTNDKGNNYTVRDIYVCSQFPSFEITMGRTTYTSDEVRVGYRHSHIYKGNFTSLTSFCTGGASTPINRLVKKYRGRRYNDFETLVQSFIVEVERMIRIESNAGGPYICFSTVGKNSEGIPLKVGITNDYFFKTERLRQLFKGFVDYYCSLYLDKFYHDGRNWQLDATDAEFIGRVTKVAKTWRKTKNANIYEKVNVINGLYYSPSSDTKYCIHPNACAEWTFKGDNPKLTVIDTRKPDIKDEYIVDLDYISYLYSFLINLINGVYANKDKYKDSIHSRAYKIKTSLIEEM